MSNKIVRTAALIAVSYYTGQWAYNKYIGHVAGKHGALYGTTRGMMVTAKAVGGAAGGAALNVASTTLNGGSLSDAFKSGFQGALGGALVGSAEGYFGSKTWSASRITADTVAGGVASTINGGRFGDGLKTAFAGSALFGAALKMRELMVSQSRLNPLNALGKSFGFKGDGFKLAGGRHNEGLLEQVASPLGGTQGGQGQFFGVAYEPGSWMDLLAESYAGPHDFLNSGFWYNASGNIRQGLSPLARGFGEVLNAANVVVATPFVAASVTPSYAYSAYNDL